MSICCHSGALVLFSYTEELDNEEELLKIFVIPVREFRFEASRYSVLYSGYCAIPEHRGTVI
jgi:hypothetical protein